MMVDHSKQLESMCEEARTTLEEQWANEAVHREQLRAKVELVNATGSHPQEVRNRMFALAWQQHLMGGVLDDGKFEVLYADIANIVDGFTVTMQH